MNNAKTGDTVSQTKSYGRQASSAVEYLRNETGKQHVTPPLAVYWFPAHALYRLHPEVLLQHSKTTRSQMRTLQTPSANVWM